jgi:membrane carboxypeptidase/penicillin-binding protein PbpC
MLSDKTARYREFYPGNPLEVDRPAAAKTGTTDSFRDNWTIGYTPHLTVGVWAGNSNNSIMRNVIGITGAGPIWHDIMEYASRHYNLPPDDFIPPANVHKSAVSALSGLLPRPGEPTVTDWFIDGTMPTIQGPETVSILPMCQDNNEICQIINQTEPVAQSQSQNNWPLDSWPLNQWPLDNWPQVNWPENSQPQSSQPQNDQPQNSQPQDNSGQSNPPDQSEHHSHHHHHHSHHHD